MGSVGENQNSVEVLPKVQSFPPTASVDELVAAIKLAGGCIIKNVLTLEQVKQIETDLRPYLDQDVPWEGPFFPPETRRAYGLVDKSPTCAESLILNPLYQGVCDTFLTERFWSWSGTEKLQCVSPPQLNNSIAFSIGPGAGPQPLHRDDHAHLVVNPKVDVYPENPGQARRDTAIGFFVAGKKTTKENGATRFIPGSHLWEHERPPDESLTVYAELEPGDGFIMLASCYHGGSPNLTKDQERLVYSCFMTRGFLRQEENQYLTYGLDKVRGWSEKMQKVLGYTLSEPACGWVAGKDPSCVLHDGVKTMHL